MAERDDREIQGLLDALQNIENEIERLENTELHERFKELRKKVEAALQKQEKENIARRSDIQSLKKELKNLKEEKEALEKKFALAEVTWVWEAHLARFVVDPEVPIFEFGRFGQMTEYLRNLNTRRNRTCWAKIQSKLSTSWTRKHWDVINTVRNERNRIAHPSLIVLDDLVQSEFKKMSPEYQQRMRDMLNILKMTASLMKFGRLAAFYEGNKDLFSAHVMDGCALKEIISWNRNFEEIDGLQMIQHDEAKDYLKKYVDDSRRIHHYFSIVDFIKDENSRRLGQLAWKMTESFWPKTQPEFEALETLQKLYPKPHNEITIGDPIIAKIHIPDFLPKNLWKIGAKIVESYCRFFHASTKRHIASI